MWLKEERIKRIGERENLQARKEVGEVVVSI